MLAVTPQNLTARRRHRGPPLNILRHAQVRRILADRYGPILPDDDAGRDDLFVMLSLRVTRGEGELVLRRVVDVLAPWMSDQEATALLDRVYDKIIKWTAVGLGRRLNLTDADRTRLKVWMIAAVDVSPEERLERRSERRREYQRKRRQAKRKRTRAQYEAESLSRTRPWEAEGISRRTWERRRRRDASGVASKFPLSIGYPTCDNSVAPPDSWHEGIGGGRKESGVWQVIAPQVEPPRLGAASEASGVDPSPACSC
jgi:hypothetical protein